MWRAIISLSLSLSLSLCFTFAPVCSVFTSFFGGRGDLT